MNKLMNQGEAMVDTEKNPTVILGGTFDPVHNGHIRIAHEIQNLIPQAEITFMPVGIPPHRQATFATAKQRLAMLTLALESETSFVIDNREIIKSTPSYSIESVEEMHLQQPDQSLIWVMGRDAFENLTSWKRAEEFANNCHLLVVERPGYIENKDSLKISQQLGFVKAKAIEELFPQTLGKIIHLSLSMLDISSTQVRELINSKLNTQLLIADKVRTYIETHKLYQ